MIHHNAYHHNNYRVYPHRFGRSMSFLCVVQFVDGGWVFGRWHLWLVPELILMLLLLLLDCHVHNMMMNIGILCRVIFHWKLLNSISRWMVGRLLHYTYTYSCCRVQMLKDTLLSFDIQPPPCRSFIDRCCHHGRWMIRHNFWSIRHHLLSTLAPQWQLLTYLWYQLHNGHNFSTTRPMKAMSSVLEGPHRALSIRRIASLIGRLLIQSTRLKTGLESDQLGKIWHWTLQPVFQSRSQNNQNERYDNQSKALFTLIWLVPSLRHNKISKSKYSSAKALAKKRPLQSTHPDNRYMWNPIKATTLITSITINRARANALANNTLLLDQRRQWT